MTRWLTIGTLVLALGVAAYILRVERRQATILHGTFSCSSDSVDCSKPPYTFEREAVDNLNNPPYSLLEVQRNSSSLWWTSSDYRQITVVDPTVGICVQDPEHGTSCGTAKYVGELLRGGPR